MSGGESPLGADPAERIFPGDGEMARRMRTYPWASSPPGEPRDWPASLRTACRICLTSRFPMILWWGEQLLMVYNDAYLPLMGNKHPGLMRPGQQVWTEIWDTVGPMLESVLHTGQATWSEDMLLAMDRHGYWEETYWTYSYSPLHDDDGTVRGVFTAVRETTEQVVSRRRLDALQDLGTRAGQARSVTEACDLVIRSLERAGQDVPFAAIYLRDPDGGHAVPVRSTAPDADPGGWPVDEVLRDGQPVTLADVSARFGELPAGGWATPPAEAMVLPLTGGTGEPTGTIVLAASAGRALDEAYRSFLGLVAQQTVALVNGAVAYQAQLRRAEAAIEGLEAGADDYLVKPFSAAELPLQRAILGPSRLPAGFAVRYEPATRPLEIGGDWYDIVELPDGRIGIMVGDCVGHDLGAATVMGQLRSACRALLLQDASPSQALTAMDRFASFVPGAECATVFCGILDTGTGQLTYSSAAHPPGIVVHPDGSIVLLEDARSLPLAIRQDAGRTDAVHTLPSRSTLLLYTDGLVERRRRPLTDGIAATAAAVRAASGAPLEDLAAQVMTQLAPAGGYEDDVAMVLYHHPAPLEVMFSAESEQLATVRTKLRGWLRSCDVSTRIAQDVLVAVGEAIANAIEHGHRQMPGKQVRLRAVSTADRLRLIVADSGRWRISRPDDQSLRGHGIALMRALMNEVTIEPGPLGTTVDMYVRTSHVHPA
jgi:anti-sigma regulatory factor (Ser/Thr protein kinase)